MSDAMRRVPRARPWVCDHAVEDVLDSHGSELLDLWLGVSIHSHGCTKHAELIPNIISELQPQNEHGLAINA